MGDLFVAFVIVVVVLLILIGYMISIYNKLVMLRNNVDKSFANIDVLLKQRADEIPNLVSVVKQSMIYERSVLGKLTELRAGYMRAERVDDKINVSNQISSSMHSVFAISENYPDLKANTSLIELQRRVSQLEDHIADRREFYNESVNMYNIGIAEFPNVLFAKLMGHTSKTMLEVTEKEKKYDGVKF